MIKVLLVDDEYYIRERLKITIDWESIGFCIVGEAKNGTDALEAIERLSPNLLLLDIKMPEMDGLCLAQQVHQRYPGILTIILTGFDLFEYVHKALHFGVVGYLLKPINRTELLEQLEQVRIKLSIQDQNAENMLLFRQIQQEDCMNFLLFDEGVSPDELKEPINALTETLHGGIILLCRIIDKLITHEMKRSIAKRLSFSFPDVYCYLFQPSESMLGLCLCKPDQEINNEVLSQLCRQIRHEVSVNIRFAVSEKFDGSKNLKPSYHQALFTMQESIFHPEPIVTYTNIMVKYTQEVIPLDTLRDNILMDLRSGKKEHALELVDVQFRLLQDKYCSYSNLLLLVNELNSIAVIYGDGLHVFGVSNQLYFKIFLEGYNTVSEIQNWFVQTFDSLYEIKTQSKQSVPHQIIQQTKEVIEQNYSNPNCNLDFVSRQVYRNPNYLSGLFKKICGISIMQYITNCRMERAQQLLKSKQLRLTDICEQVGYNDVFYFSRKFKQYFGVPPSDF